LRFIYSSKYSDHFLIYFLVMKENNDKM